MRVILLAVGRLKAGPEREIFARYLDRAALAARTAGLTGVEAREIEESRARRSEDRKSEEASAVRALVPPGSRLIILDERGTSVSSEAFAGSIGRARDAGVPACVLVVGGPDGIDATLRAEGAMVVAFGAMTWPHQLVRILAAEQIYRAVTILAGHPYHRV